MFSHWVKASACQPATAAALTKILQEDFSPAWKIAELHSNWGTHSTRQILHQVCKTWPML